MEPHHSFQHPLPRVILYYQTHHSPSTGLPISVLPLINNNHPQNSITHLILAAIHINQDPKAITINDKPPSDPHFSTLWTEMHALQAAGVKVMGMLGGAARGSYARLDGSHFDAYYTPLRNLIRERRLDGLDLGVKEEMSLAGIIRLVDRLRADFGPDFIITFAPVATALLDSAKNVTGFDYEALEVLRGRDISWYNAQFYGGWGDFSNSEMFEHMVHKGWSPEKLTIGLITSPAHGGEYVPWEVASRALKHVSATYPSFGGVSGWELSDSLPGGEENPWEWAKVMTRLLRGVPHMKISDANRNVKVANVSIAELHAPIVAKD